MCFCLVPNETAMDYFALTLHLPPIGSQRFQWAVPAPCKCPITGDAHAVTRSHTRAHTNRETQKEGRREKHGRQSHRQQRLKLNHSRPANKKDARHKLIFLVSSFVARLDELHIITFHTNLC